MTPARFERSVTVKPAMTVSTSNWNLPGTSGPTQLTIRGSGWAPRTVSMRTFNGQGASRPMDAANNAVPADPIAHGQYGRTYRMTFRQYVKSFSMGSDKPHSFPG